MKYSVKKATKGWAFLINDVLIFTSTTESGALFVKAAMEKKDAQIAVLEKIESLARDAVEAGGVEECYLSLLREALDLNA